MLALPKTAEVFPPLLVEKLGWLQVHSLWQIAVIAIFAAGIDRILNRSAGAAKYLALLSALTLTVAATVV